MTHDEAVKRAAKIANDINTDRNSMGRTVDILASELQQAYREGMKASMVIAEKKITIINYDGSKLKVWNYAQGIVKAIRTAMNKVEGN